MTEGELKGQQFLNYVGQNIKRLKKNLKKNITYDDGLFDDVFQESIIKIYDSIVKNNKDVGDYEKYFFISSKFNYIIRQNQERKRINNRINIDDYMKKEDIEYRFDEDMDVKQVISDLKNLIEEEFGEDECDIYFDYMSHKVHGGMSYSKYSQLTGIPTNKVSEIVSKIKNFCKNSDVIKRNNYFLDI